MNEAKPFTAEDLKKFGIGSQNKSVHDVNLIVHTPQGAISVKAQRMTDDQLADYKGTLRTKITAGQSGYLELKTDDGLILIPHEMLINSVIQLFIDAEPIQKKPEKEEPEESIGEEEP